MLEAERKLAAHLQILMHDWPKEARHNTIDHVLAALAEQRAHERAQLRETITRAADLIDKHLYSQREKVRDASAILRRALES